MEWALDMVGDSGSENCARYRAEAAKFNRFKGESGQVMHRFNEGSNGVGDVSGNVGSSETCSNPSGVAFEKHYSVQHVADLWNFGVDKVRELFRDEPGVIMEGCEESRYKRGYINMRISESAIRRVYAKLTAQRK